MAEGAVKKRGRPAARYKPSDADLEAKLRAYNEAQLSGAQQLERLKLDFDPPFVTSKTQLSVLRKKFGLGKFEKTPSGRKSVSKKTDLAEQHRRLIKDELASRGKDYVGARKLAASIKEAHGVKIPVYMIRKIQRDLNPNIKWTSKPTGALDANGEPVFEIVPDSDAEEEYEIELDDDEDGDGDDDGDELVAVVDDGESDEDVSEPTAGPSRSS